MYLTIQIKLQFLDRQVVFCYKMQLYKPLGLDLHCLFPSFYWHYHSLFGTIKWEIHNSNADWWLFLDEQTNVRRRFNLLILVAFRTIVLSMWEQESNWRNTISAHLCPSTKESLTDLDVQMSFSDHVDWRHTSFICRMALQKWGWGGNCGECRSMLPFVLSASAMTIYTSHNRLTLLQNQKPVSQTEVRWVVYHIWHLSQC